MGGKNIVKLLKCAYKVGDKNLISQALRILALENIAETNKKIIRKVAQSNLSMNVEQQAFWSQIEDKLLRIFENAAWRKTQDKNLVEDLMYEGILAAIEALVSNWNKYDVSESNDHEKMVRHLITTGVNEITDKYVEEMSSKSVGESKYIANTHPFYKEFLDKKFQQEDINPTQLDEESVEYYINEWEPLLYDAIREANRNLPPNDQIPLNDDYFQKQLWRYKGRLEQKRTPFLGSIEQPQYGDSTQEEGTVEGVGDRSEASLLTLLGASPFDLPEDAAIRGEVMNQILPLVYQIPIPYRMIMVSHYGIDPDILQQTNELDKAIEEAAVKAGIDNTEEFLQTMKTKAGTRLSWSATQRLIDAAYEGNVLKGIGSISDFENTIRSYFSDLIDDLG
jgi:hypothetical protein